MQSTVVPLALLVTADSVMVEVLRSGRISTTPTEPIYICVRKDMPGRFEVSDGHHRIAAALRAGQREIHAIINPDPDDEPYDPPFYTFPT